MKTRQQIESIARGKRKLRLTLILLGIIAVLVAAAIVIGIVFKNTDTDDEQQTAEPPVAIGDEDVYRGTLVAYPVVDDADITRITVSNNNKDGEYTLLRSETIDNNFMFTYMENGEVKIYYPSICDADSYFEYDSLYALETNDGYGTISKLSYLLSALEVSYFGERIPLSKDPAEREAQYKQFGLQGENTSVVIFDYEDEMGVTQTHKVVIGDRTVTGVGYYFTVDDRDYVYNSLSVYLDYALLGFYSYVNSALVSEGLEGDSTLEPLYTSDFTHWKTELHKNAGETVPDEAEIVISANLSVPIDPSSYIDDPSSYADGLNGYSSSGYTDMIVDLFGSAANEIKNSIIGREIGVYYDPSDPNADKTTAISLTVPIDTDSSHSINLTASPSVKYHYEICEIEAIVNSNDDISAVGTPVGDNNVIRVAYRFTVNGKQTADIVSHAVLDLTSPALPTEAVSALRALSVGPLDESDRVAFDINYTEENALATSYKSKITEIINILSKTGKTLEKVEEDSIVVYRYQIMVNGELRDEEYTDSIDLSAATSGAELAIKNELVGRKTSRYLSIIIDEGNRYYEVFRAFRAYEISEIKYFVTRKEVVSFSFLSNSERDPFYGDSIYQNNTDGYLLYGLDNSACDHILDLVGGIGENTSNSVGLQGTETVAVGLTPEKLLEFGLYEHRIYFELPRGLIPIDSGDEDTIDDYTSYEKLGFTLYISDILDDGTRYVASDLYDVITKVGNDVFFFLDETFTGFWARDNLIMTDVEFMQNIKVEFNFEDLTGSYELDIDHKTSYITSTGLQVGGTPPKSYSDTFDYITVNVHPGENCTPNKLTEYIADNDRNYMSLTELYNHLYTDKDVQNEYFTDSLGTTYFKEFIRAMFYVDFEGAMSPEEQKDAFENYPMLMKFSIKIDTDKDGDSEDEGYYNYEFYRCSDRRVLVRLYRTTDDGAPVGGGEVSDFYISSYGFRRIVTTFVALLNGELFDLEAGYN
ncbi:MAG: hypothetical protein IJ515_00845 [Clostridia bacterium]|nr:hypothetical protein [Clostridia bacterium]